MLKIAGLNQQIFFVVSAVFLLGFILSRMVRQINFPRVTGYILAGIFFGPYILNIFSENTLPQLEFIPQMALGIVAFIIGAGLSIELIARLKFRLIVLTLMESLGAAVLVFFLLSLFKIPLGAALALAAISAATAPAATLAVIKEYRASGPLTETALAVVALDDAVAIVLFGLILTLDPAHLSFFSSSTINSLTVSAVEIAKAVMIGATLGVLGFLLTKLSKESSDNLIIITGIAFLGIGIAIFTNTSTLLTNMFLGFTFINITPKNQEIVSNFERILPLIYCAFFVLAGAHLNITIFRSAGLIMLLWCVIFVFARIAGKMIGAFLGGLVSRAPDPIIKYLGLTLAPQAGVAIGLSLLITEGSSFYSLKSIILNVTLMGVAVNELVGPLLTRFALFRAGEVNIIEENISPAKKA